MKLSLIGITYVIKWGYTEVDGRRVTECKLRTMDSREWLRSEKVSCDSRDSFSKSAGRKKTLSRLISHWPKTDRKSIWREYFKQCPSEKVTID